jgi:hypothetical protein
VWDRVIDKIFAPFNAVSKLLRRLNVIYFKVAR